MGASAELIAIIAKQLDITTSKVTDEHIATYNLGKADGSKNNEEAKTPTKTPIDTRSTGAGFDTKGAGPFVDLLENAENLKNALSPTSITTGVDELISKSQELGNNMGVGKARAAEFRAMIADSVPEMVKLGFSEEKTLEIMENIPKQLGVNTTLTKETIVEIGSAAKISGTEAGDLANKFKGVGFNLADVGDKMAEVANYAKSVGVNVNAVGKEVVANIGKLNTLNFENGIKGLTKMVAQSQMLGINMDSVLRKGEDLLNPESAIEFSSALQRLGVQSSALLDPLSAMDMALNDPQALQNEMVKVSQQFTRLKADGSGFEILPGAKLQLREVAKSMGMTAEEFANMSIKSADLEMKMSKIRFPGFAASEEDKMLIANMAQMKDGRAMVTIAKEGGGTEEVDVEALTAGQIEKLKEEQANQNKTAEELARDQLDVLKDISQQLKGSAKGLQYGAASAGPVQRMTNTVNELRSTVTNAVTSRVTAEGTREKITGVVGGVEEGFVNAIAKGDYMSLFTELQKLPSKIVEATTGIAGGGLSALSEILTNGEANIVKEYSGISGVKPGETNVTGGITNVIDKLKEALTGGENTTQTDQTKTVNVNQTLEIKGATDQVTSSMIKTAMDSWWNDKISNPAEMNKITEGMDKSMSGSGMAK